MPYRKKSCLKLVNLENGNPSVPTALGRLEDALRDARREGFAAVKIIHGYGSSGSGGVLRERLQAELAQRAVRGEVRAFIAGEDWRISNQESWELLNSCPELKRDSDLGRKNRGISIVVF